ncbi:MAG: hypothetical protein ABIZ80_02710, partial [Bryobacteraceae bacterium]
MIQILLFALLAAAASAADPYIPSPQEKQAIQAKVSELGSRVKILRSRGADPGLIADIDVYRKAAEWILRYPEEFYTKAYAANAMAALGRGLARVEELEAGTPSWPKQTGRLVRAYVSKVDGSVQPYGLIIP